MTEPTLDAATATRFAALALDNIVREYPNHPQHVWRDGSDARTPRELHPAFFGSYDWHSCVHMHWLLARIRRLHPGVRQRAAIAARFDEHFATEAIAAECAYLARPQTQSFERTYGWAWLLMLNAELSRHESMEGKLWSTTLKPLSSEFVTRFTGHLPRATYPIRVGTHFNSAFAMALALEYADAMRDKRFGRLLRARAVSWYSNDADCQAWEPGGDDFLSSALIEAECMRRALDADLFSAWLARFLPRIAARDPITLFTPVTVSDRTDGKIAHLDGLNLSRAWCWRSIARTLREDDPCRALVLDAAAAHMKASMPHVAGDYAGEHWLATFALLSLLA